MLTLNDGRSELWQWDTNRKLTVDADCSQVHFSNKVFGRSIDVDVVDGVAIIPDILLQTDKDLNVWAFVGTAENGYTKISKTFKVNRRNKPADYVFTPTDQMTLQTIQSQIGDLADLTTEAKDTLVSAINEAARTGGGGGGSTVELDTTLTQSGKAADAKAVGDALAGKQDTISDLATIRSGAAKGATALQTVPSTYRTAFEQDVIDSGLGDRIEVIEGKEAGWDAKSDFSGSYNDLTDKPTIPTALPNPNALTFTGAATGSYDGSEAKTIEIPSGGGGGVSYRSWSKVWTLAVAEDIAGFEADNINLDGKSEIMIVFISDSTASRTMTNGRLYINGVDAGKVLFNSLPLRKDSHSFVIIGRADEGIEYTTMQATAEYQTYPWQGEVKVVHRMVSGTAGSIMQWTAGSTIKITQASATLGQGVTIEIYVR